MKILSFLCLPKMGNFNILIILTAIHISQANNILTEVNKDKIVHHHHHNTTAEVVTIYTESNFWGVKWTITVSNCTDVPGLLYKKASSIDTHDNCVLLYGRQECEGRHVRVAPGTDGHSHLSEIDFDDTLASVGPCSEDDSDESITHAERKEKRSIRVQRNIITNLIGQPSTTLDDCGDETDDGNSRQDSDENGLQALFRRFNLKSIVSRFQVASNDDSFN